MSLHLGEVQRLPCSQRMYTLFALFLCVFFIFFTGQYYVQRPSQRQSASPSTSLPANNKFADDHRPFVQDRPAQRPPSVDYIVLADDQELPSKPYDPYPEYSSRKYTRQWRGSHRPCMGPRGVDVNHNSDDMISARFVSSSAFNPNPMIGSFDETGVDDAHCFDRNGRLSTYGFRESGGEGGFGKNQNQSETKQTQVDWDNVNWGSLQAQCLERNADRFRHSPAQDPDWVLQQPDTTQKRKSVRRESKHPRALIGKTKEYKDRTAVVLRAWDTVEYNPDVLQTVRAMISELTLHTGGEYSVILMVEIKDEKRDIFGNDAEYRKALNDYVPHEFHNLTVLFNQDLLNKWYPKIDQSQGQRIHMNKPLQLFSVMHPEFEHVWQLELDIRFTGHWYNLFQNAASWAREQPRKLQWERAAKFYIPSYHNGYDNFSASVAAANIDGGIWGPVKNAAVESPRGPTPPVATALEDDYVWGVGNESDVISVSPIINLDDTKLFEYDMVFGLPEGYPKRSLMVTPVVRLSKHLLKIMHDSQMNDGIHLRSELLPHTLALLHGLKIAALPMPTFLDHQGEVTGPAEVDLLFNAEGENGTFTNSAAQKIVDMRARITYWWRLEFEQYPRMLYRRWYGLDPEGKSGGDATNRLCLPGILLHPVKDVERP